MKFKGLLKVALLLVAVSALFVACDTLAGGRFPHVEKVYMKPGEDWASDNPSYAAWMWTDGKEGSWTELTKSTVEEGLWEVAVPSEIDNIIFVKMKDGTTKDKFSWDNKEEQTGDLKVPYVFDKVEVYSIKAKEWIALGAEEKEPEKPVLEPVAISAAEFTSLKYAAQNNPNDIELDGEKSFTFYASAKTYKFKYTDGTWAFTAVTGEAITELDKEYPIVKKGDTGYDNIELKKLTAGAEYKVTLIHKDGFAYVKVEATGNVKEVELDKLTADELAKVTHIAGEMNSWNKTALTENSYLFKAGSKNEFLILDGTNTWDFKLGSAIIEELDEEYPLFKGGDNITFEEGVLTKGKNYLITVVIKESVVYVKVTEYTAKIEYVEKVYLQLDNAWYNSGNRFAAYFFDDTEIAWSDVATEVEDGIYEVAVPTGASKVIFCQMDPATTTNAWVNPVKKQTADLSIPQKGDTKVVYSLKASAWKAENDLPEVDYTPILDCGIVYTPEQGYIYLLATTTGDFSDSNNWTSGNAWFTAWCWGSSSELDSFVTFEKVVEHDKLYRAKVNDYKQCKILRFGPDYSEPVWDKQWNTTGELTIPSNSDVCLVITQWDGQTSGWLPFATE